MLVKKEKKQIAQNNKQKNTKITLLVDVSVLEKKYVGFMHYNKQQPIQTGFQYINSLNDI